MVPLVRGEWAEVKTLVMGQAVRAAGGRLPTGWPLVIPVQEHLTYVQKREAQMGVTDLSGSRLAGVLVTLSSGLRA